MLLKGTRIVSFCHFLQGPAAAQYLADMGADVIKVEPLSGAHERHWSGADVYVEDVSGFYLSANRNKRSIALDLKNTEGHEIARRLIATADVVMENFRPGVFAKLGFDEAALAKINPNLIFASASGFGGTGPLALTPGQDILAQARSGLISVTGNPEYAPTPVGAAIVDQHGGALMAMGILGALVRKLRDGVGTRVESSLINAAVDLQAEPLVNYFAGGLTRDVLNRQKNLATWFHAAPYGVYQTEDGHVVVSLCDPLVLAEALESETLREAAAVDRFLERDDYAERVAEAVSLFTTASIAKRFDKHGVWWAPVNYYDELLADEQLVHSKVFRQVTVRGRTIHLVNHPNRYDGEVPELRLLALEIGEHTREILTELGYGKKEVESLLSAKVAAASRINHQTTKKKAS